MAQIERRETKSGGVRWTARVFVRRDEAGKRKFTTRTFTTKKEADAWARKMETRKDQGVLSEPSRETVLEYLERWLRERAPHKVRPRTLSDYRGVVARYVKPLIANVPHIGSVRLDRLTPAGVQSFYDQLASARGLAVGTMRSLHAVVHQALQEAVELEILPRNPAARRKPPGVKKPRQVRAMSKEQADAFLGAAEMDPHYALWVVLLTGGLRPSEALALQWEDLEGPVVRVRRTLVRRGVDGWALEEPKTARSRRSVALPAIALRALRAQRARQAEEKLATGGAYQDHGFIFATAQGQPLDVGNLSSRNFRRILQAAGLGEFQEQGRARRFKPAFRLYDLRHTAATLLLRAGELPKNISEQLGHTSVAFTMDTYTHVLPDMRASAAEKMEAMFG